MSGNSTPPSGASVIQAGVVLGKPRFTDINRSAIVRLLGQDGRSVDVSNVRGGGENAGASSGVVVFDASIDGVERGYVLRYAPMKNERRLFLDYRIPEQAGLQKKLAQARLPVPDSFWVDPDGRILGVPGFVMERIDGEVAHAAPFSSGLVAEASQADRLATIGSIHEVLGRIHSVDWQALDLQRDVCRAEGRTYLERYINWYWKTVEWVADKASLSRLDAVRQWLFSNQPSHHPDDASLIHGDPSLGNYMLQEGRVAAAIDWELSGIVSPSYDIAMQCLANSFYRQAAPESAAIIPTDAEWIASYEERSGRRLKDFNFYMKAACLPLLTVHLSMRRSIPQEMLTMHSEMTEATWAVAEAH